MKSTKYHYRVLMIRLIFDDGSHTLVCFRKDCKKQKDVVKDSDR